MTPLEELRSAYRASLPPGAHSDVPMTEPDCRRLQELVRPSSRIVEWGAGASTVAIASSHNRPARWALVEPDLDWAAHVLGWLARNGLPPPDAWIWGSTAFHICREERPDLAIVDGGPDYFSRSVVLGELLGRWTTGPELAIVVDDWQAFCRPTLEGMGAVAWDRAGFLDRRR